MANPKNSPAMPRVSIDDAVGPWSPGQHPSSGTRQIGTGGDLGRLERKVRPPQPQPRPPTRVRKGS